MRVIDLGHGQPLQQVAGSPCGRWLAAVRNTGVVDVWDMPAARTAFRTQRSGQGGGVAWEPESGTLLVRDNRGLIACRPPDPRPHIVAGPPVWAMATAGGRVVGATFVAGELAPELVGWRASAGEIRREWAVGLNWSAGDVAIEPQGQWCVYCLGLLSVRSMTDGRLAYSAQGPMHVRLLGLLDDRRAILAADTVLQLYDVAAARTAAQLKLPGQTPLRAVASPDGRSLLARTGAGAFLLSADPLAVRQRYRFPALGKPTCVAFAPDGLTAACGTSKGEVVVWDVD